MSGSTSSMQVLVLVPVLLYYCHTIRVVDQPIYHQPMYHTILWCDMYSGMAWYYCAIPPYQQHSMVPVLYGMVWYPTVPACWYGTSSSSKYQHAGTSRYSIVCLLLLQNIACWRRRTIGYEIGLGTSTSTTLYWKERGRGRESDIKSILLMIIIESRKISGS